MSTEFPFVQAAVHHLKTKVQALTKAHAALGECNVYGSGNLPKDYEQASQHYQTALILGDQRAKIGLELIKSLQQSSKTTPLRTSPRCP